MCALPTGLRHCPPDFGFVDHLTFHTVNGRIVTATASASGCAFVSVAAGDAKIGLEGTVDAQIMTELGLPANYGR